MVLGCSTPNGTEEKKLKILFMEYHTCTTHSAIDPLKKIVGNFVFGFFIMLKKTFLTDLSFPHLSCADILDLFDDSFK